MARPSSVSNVSRLATSTTLIPDAAICRANSLPIPDEAPVTSAHGPNCPLSSVAFIVLFLSVDCTCCSVQAFIPPSTVRFAPVMYEDSGPATNATIAAISSTRPKRSSAVAAFCGTAHSLVAGFNSVSIGPGCTLLTVMPRPPKLSRQRLSKYLYGSLRGRVGDKPGHNDMLADGRTNHNDTAAALHVLQRRVGRDEHAADVDVDYAIHLFQRCLLKRFRNGSAGIVYQDV